MRNPQNLFLLVGLLALVSAAAWTPRAKAYEDRVIVGGGPIYSAAIGDDVVGDNGVGLNAFGSWGWNNKWTLQGFTGFAIHPATATMQKATVGMLGTECVYSLDIVRFVPFVGAGADGFIVGTSTGRRGELGLHLVGGADFWIDRNWVLGLHARFFWLPLDRSALDPTVLQVGLVIGRSFDLF